MKAIHKKYTAGVEQLARKDNRISELTLQLTNKFAQLTEAKKEIKSLEAKKKKLEDKVIKVITQSSAAAVANANAKAAANAKQAKPKLEAKQMMKERDREHENDVRNQRIQRIQSLQLRSHGDGRYGLKKLYKKSSKRSRKHSSRGDRSPAPSSASSAASSASFFVLSCWESPSARKQKKCKKKKMKSSRKEKRSRRDSQFSLSRHHRRNNSDALKSPSLPFKTPESDHEKDIRMIFPLRKLIMGRMQLSQNLDQPILVVEAKKAKSPNPFPNSPSTSS
eukprot:scaffold376799_cov83-Cyclotella_meneghiniana.AAC.1